MRFQGTKNYIASDDLKLAVDAALNLEKPLLVKGEPGTGKTMLAIEVAESLGMRLLVWHIKSTTNASQGLDLEVTTLYLLLFFVFLLLQSLFVILLNNLLPF